MKMGAKMKRLEQQITDAKEWMGRARFDGITRLYSAQQIAEQQGTIADGYSLARDNADAFHERLRELFNAGKNITTFGPYSPGQAVTMKRHGIEGIYVGGWATSAKGSLAEDPGADLASYPLSQVPDEAGPIVRALLTADKNQHFLRSKMTEEEREKTPEVDYRPFIIADADTGHGGDAHVRNLIRRFVEVGVTGYHIEDQKPGVKKCGHQGGKVLVGVDEQIKRLNAARFQLDVMKVAGLIVARTDAESATFIESRNDERDQPFILGATNVSLPSYKSGFIAILRHFNAFGIDDVRGHMLFEISDDEHQASTSWLKRTGVLGMIKEHAEGYKEGKFPTIDTMLDPVVDRYLQTWQAEAGLKTFGRAIADVIAFRSNEGEQFDLSVNQWDDFAKTASFFAAREKARSLGINIIWDPEHPKTPEGYYQIKNGLEYCIAKSLAVAPFTDLIWMETKTAHLKQAKAFSDAVHAKYPEKMLAYNLSPSFNWDTTGMSDEDMQKFPEEIGKLGFVFTFITYGGHQIDGIAAEEFSRALKEDGMLALAQLQRKIRLLESPYRTPQTLVGGPRLDAALMACSGRTATTKAMGKGSTQSQHLIQTEVPTKVLEGWLDSWRQHNDVATPMRVELKPHKAGSELLELQILGRKDDKVANVIFASIVDRRGNNILSIRDQNTFDHNLRKKRLMTLVHVFLIHRYKVNSIHYVTPTDDNQHQTQKMLTQGLFSDVAKEVGQIIVAKVNGPFVASLLDADGKALTRLLSKG
ncbi:MAG: isocitrate lyase [Deltaproteobacteria bacterium RIFOXYA12_FULL_58_15]|nr:MAG: isocitrate lyase [Deltaproteobacteria bacterium RIFOXYA12_FULL_58_15]OGR11857.1 MAG: isocitrate lyase [Deltaproteobacteria bacterium RIFOXYB12_FULL_58_9]